MLVLMVLASHADAHGVCYPNYDRLEVETGLCRQSISDALKYWKDQGVLSWARGWGNRYSQKPNVYTFDESLLFRAGLLKVREGCTVGRKGLRLPVILHLLEVGSNSLGQGLPLPGLSLGSLGLRGLGLS